MTAIIFPRAAVDIPIASMSFYPDPMIEVTPLRSGRKISADLGPTLWRAKWSAEHLREDQMGQVRAWYDTLLSAQEFYGYDRMRQYPLAYPNGFGGLTVGGSPFTGAAGLHDVASNMAECGLVNLPVGFVLAPGDYFAFDYGSAGAYRALHRIVAGGTADADGKLTVEVRPYIRAGWTPDAPATYRDIQFSRPAARMVIVPGTYSEQVTYPAIGQVSFEAVQTL